MAQRLPQFAAALWWGSLSAIGFMAVPLLFAHLPTPAMAGNMAAQLFAAQTWVSVVCCLVLLVLSRQKGAETLEEWAREAIGFVVAGLLFALLVQYGVAPRIVARENLKLWHSLGSVLYVLQWACAAAVLWRLTEPPRP